MTRVKPWIWLLLFGAAWGMNELVVGGAIYQERLPHAPAWLTAWALFVLAAARMLWPRPGSSTAIGVVAAAFKLIHTEPFYCHLLGIVLLGVAFDFVASFAFKEGRSRLIPLAVTGMLSAYAGHFLFAALSTWVFQSEYWVAGGWSKIGGHVFITGGYAALMSAVLVPLGYWLGMKMEGLAGRHPQGIFNCAVAAAAVLWVLGAII
ncbi:MAG: hypothetical protein ACYTG7_04725 [Planctomycetota bacterium]|jgi:hypothetical protein